MDLPGSRWSRGLTTVLPVASAEVRQVRVGQFSEAPPVTRVVFDLSVPAREVTYETVAATGQGRLRVRVQEAGPGQGVTQASGVPLVKPKTGPAAHPAAASLAAPAPKAAEPEAPLTEQSEVGAATTGPVAAAEEQPIAAPRRPQPAATRPSVELPREEADANANGLLGGGLSRYALTGVIIVLAWAAAAWARRRFHREVGGLSQPVAMPAPEPVREEGMLHCKVVDGYLVLAPEKGQQGSATLAPGTTVEARGDLTVAITVAEEAPALPEEMLVSPAPAVTAPTRGASLAAMTHDSDASARANALQALGQLGEAAAEYDEDILERVDDSDPTVRARAIEALVAVSPESEQAARLMVQLLADREPLVRQAACLGAVTLAGRGLAEPMVELLADLTRRSQALELLQLADEPTLRNLLTAARNADPEVGEPAMETLSYVMSTRWTVADFAQELSSSEAEVRMAGVEGLSIVGGVEAMRELQRLVRSDPSPEVKARAAQVLAVLEEEQRVGSAAGREDG
jgi:HEAT repeat protein